MSTSARVIQLAPSLSADTRIDDTLAAVTTQLSPTGFGTNHSEAVAALTAHMLLKSPLTGSGLNAGAVTSVKTGKRSVNYGGVSVAGISSNTADLMTTAPGAYFASLRSSSAGIGFEVLF